MNSESVQAASAETSGGMSAFDLTLFIIVTVFGLRWVAVAAGAGPSSLVVWAGAAVLFFLPLIICVIELGRRYPEEGGLYSWVKHAFGDYPAFITGWTYWASNLPYFPGLLYFAAGNALLMFRGGAKYSDNGEVIGALALAGLAIAVFPNILGMARGKWVQNIGALAYWIPAVAIIVFGTAIFIRYGSATVITSRNIVPSIGLDNALAWSTIAFAFGGVEGISLVATQARNPRRSIPRAIVFGGLMILALYVLGTLALLWAIPSAQISSIGGFVQATDSLGARVGLHGLAPVTAALLAIGGVGGVGAWITATARLPYVAGVDRYLPSRFGRLHPRYGTPSFAMLTQAGISAVLIVIGQAGTSVRGAYDLLVAMSVISYFIPILFMFAAAYRLASRPDSTNGALVSPTVFRALSILGFAVVAIATLLALVPAKDEPRPIFAGAKLIILTLILLGVGTVLYVRGRSKNRGNEAGM